jgi:hypothetical protein
MAKRFSIIIPMRDAENYIIKALESVAEQEFADYECFVIDDHSVDRSAYLVAEFIANHSEYNIKLYAVPEGKWGAGSARNIGLEQACGDFVVFLDADDELNGSSALTRVNDVIKENPTIEVLLLGVKRVWWSGKGKKIIERVGVPKPKHLNKHYQIGHNNEGAICFTCWRRSLFTKNKITFLENTFWEDLVPKLQLFSLANQDNIKLCKHATHIYNMRPGKSIGTTPTLTKVKMMNAMHKKVGHMVEDGKISPEYERDIEIRVRNSPVLVLWMLGMGLYSAVFKFL